MHGYVNKILRAQLLSPWPCIMVPSDNDRSPIMMQRLQTLFNRLAGVASFEADRVALARAIYGGRDCRYAALETPAYLRRQARVLRGR